jgi:hypothetical protein
VSYTTLGASADGFGSIRCGTDIAKALIGKQMSNETVVALEKRHQDIGLKDVGADEISDHLSSISWLICGSEYMVLEDDKSVVRDAIKVPDHSKKSPQFMSICTVNGKDAIVFAILDNEKETSEHTLPAKIAWRIDEKKGKFVSIPVEGLRCPRSGITTSDGGR